MLERNKFFARLAVLSITTVTASAWLFAAEGDVYQLLDTSNLRKGPDSSFEVVTMVEQGETATELRSKGDWKQVRLVSGESGWAYSPSMQKVSVATVSTVEQSVPVVDVAQQPVRLLDQNIVTAEPDSAQVVAQPDVIEPVEVITSEPTVAVPTVAVAPAGPVTEVFELNGYGAVKQPVPAVDSTQQPLETLDEVGTPVAVVTVPVAAELAGTVTEAFALNGYGAVVQQDPVVNLEQQPLETLDQTVEPVEEVAAPVVAEPAIIEPVEVVTAEPAAGSVAEAFELNGYGVVTQAEPVIDVGQQPLEDLVQTVEPVETITVPVVAEPKVTETTAAVEPVVQPKTVESARVAAPVVKKREEVPLSAMVAKPTANEPSVAVVDQPLSVAKQATVPEPSKSLQSDSVQQSSVTPVFESGEKQLVKTTTIRTGPGALYEVLGWAGNGAHVVALAAQGQWMKVRMRESGRIGWIEASSIQGNAVDKGVLLSQKGPLPVEKTVTVSEPVKMDENLAIKPVEATVANKSEPLKPTVVSANKAVTADVVVISANEPEVMAIPKQQRVVPKDTAPEQNLLRFTRKANLRAGPDSKYDVVTWAGLDSFATELGASGDWLRVQMQQSKRIGWVFKSSMALVKAAIPSTSVMKVEQQQPVVTSVAAAGKLQPLRAEGRGGQLYFFKQTSNLRAGPGSKYDVVAWGARNESASEVARKGDWSRVSMTLSNKVGWVPNSALVLAASAPVAVAAPAKVQPILIRKPAATSGEMYEVVKTSTLRTDANQAADINSWVAKGSSVALLQRRNGWSRVNPQVNGKSAGWIRSDLLRAMKPELHVVRGEHVIGKHNAEQYKNRVSHNETFNFSYAALEQALYKVPVEQFHINMDSDDLEALFRKDTYDRSAFDIEMKTKGHTLDKTLLGTVNVLGSSTRVFAKKSLLIKLDKEGGRWYGHRRVALRSMASDKAMMREWMAWKLMAALGMKVPEVHFVRVSFNGGQRVGLYLSIEWMGTNFLAANNMDTRGEFYQPEDAEYCGDLNSTDRMDICFNKITPQDGDYSTLTEMARGISTASVGNMHKVLAKHFDDESVLNWITVNALVTNGDTYNKNYWLYHDPKVKKWTVIPWDYNLTYGRTYDPYVESPYKTFNDNFQYYYPPDVGASNPLKDHALRNPHLRYRLEQKIRHLLGLEANGSEATYGWFSPTVMHARIGNLASVVGKELYRDNFIVYGEDDFRKTYEALMYYVTAHANFLNKKLFGKFEWEPVDPKAPAVFDAPLPSELYGQGFINAGADSVYMTDEGWGLLVGKLVLNQPVVAKAEVKMNVEGGQKPKYLPTGYPASRCIQRSWVLSVEPRVTATADLMVEYLQENSRRSEVPVTVREQELELWMNDGDRWKPLKTEVNEYANTLTARDVPVRSGRTQRFVACSPF